MSYSWRLRRSRPALLSPVERIWRDYSKVKPIDERGFDLIRSVYAYDRAELKAETRPVPRKSAHWSLEKASFDAAYRGERVIAYLYKPTRVAIEEVLAGAVSWEMKAEVPRVTNID